MVVWMLHIELEWKHAYQIKYYKLFHQIQIPCSYTFFFCCCCVGVKECSLAALMMRPAPILALTTAKLEEEEKEKGQEEQVPRVYIKTLLDRVMAAVPWRLNEKARRLARRPRSAVLVGTRDRSSVSFRKTASKDIQVRLASV